MKFETHLTSESFFKFFVTSATYPITANVWRKNDSLMFKRVNRLDPPWRPNGPSERVLKGTMPSSTFDAQHISPLQPFSKVIISDPSKALKFRIFLKIRIFFFLKKNPNFFFCFGEGGRYRYSSIRSFALTLSTPMNRVNKNFEKND